jgi:hypothetical protein
MRRDYLQGAVSLEEGAASSQLAGYGRVHFGFTSRSTTAGSSGPLTGFRHTDGSGQAPPGSHIRIAGGNNPEWYPATIPSGTTALNNQLLWGVISDNATDLESTWFVSGTQDIVMFRQAFIASTDVPESPRVVTMFSEAATLRRTDGSSGTNDTRFMSWAWGATDPQPIRVGVEYIPATIIIVPGPGVVFGLGTGLLAVCRTRRRTT